MPFAFVLYHALHALERYGLMGHARMLHGEGRRTIGYVCDVVLWCATVSIAYGKKYGNVCNICAKY